MSLTRGDEMNLISEFVFTLGLLFFGWFVLLLRDYLWKSKRNNKKVIVLKGWRKWAAFFTLLLNLVLFLMVANHINNLTLLFSWLATFPVLIIIIKKK